ncbi:hypothetical protein B0H11DRAFT_2243107 [Mycena galericulata]|nr:hypothetical protein B0H11DRAFT_2252154 [Mycena galericulata]KAJ7458407.1 hypothetical protein B0H11DRAFT_2243107 [Mycena galericulata]
MAPPSLLFSSYRAEVSIDFNVPHLPHLVPGTGASGKVTVAQISDKLVILMVGFLGHEKPFLSLAEWRADVQATSRTVVLHIGEISPVGTLDHITGVTDLCPLRVRVALEDPAAFWALAYLLVKPLAHTADIAADVRANRRFITQMLDYFKADNGQEYLDGFSPTIQPNIFPPSVLRPVTFQQYFDGYIFPPLPPITLKTTGPLL